MKTSETEGPICCNVRNLGGTRVMEHKGIIYRVVQT
jgi:hypothetical protein